MCERRRRAEKGTCCKNNANWICRNKGYFCSFYKVIKQNKIKPVVTKFNLFWAKLPVSSCASHIQATSPFSCTRHSPFILQQQNKHRTFIALHKVGEWYIIRCGQQQRYFITNSKELNRKNPRSQKTHQPHHFQHATDIKQSTTSLLQHPNQTRPSLIALPLNCFCSKSAVGQKSVSQGFEVLSALLASYESLIKYTQASICIDDYYYQGCCYICWLFYRAAAISLWFLISSW